MKRIMACLLLIISLAGCSTVGQIEDVIAWTHQTVGEVKAQVADLTGKYEALKANQDAKMADLEKLIGHAVDADGNGQVDVEEAKNALLEAGKKQPTSLFDPSLWITLVLALLGVHTTKTAGGVALRKLRDHVTKSAVPAP